MLQEDCCTECLIFLCSGTFTNQIQKEFEEPRLLIVTDPRTDHQPIKESAYMNIPTIAFCDTDSVLPYVDIAIPANNKAKHSIGVLYWLLSRMVLQVKHSITRQSSLLQVGSAQRGFFSCLIPEQGYLSPLQQRLCSIFYPFAADWGGTMTLIHMCCMRGKGVPGRMWGDWVDLMEDIL